MGQEAKAEPTRAEEIVDLIRRQDGRGGYEVDRAAAIALIEMYASVVAAEASIKAQLRDFCAETGCSGFEEVFEAALKRKLALASHPDTAVSP